jgi:hypothetical protein
MGAEAMGLFSSLFGGKKRDELKAEAPAKAAAPPAAKAAKPSGKEKQAATSVAPAVAAASPTGAAQVKLRLKLAASLRTGEHAAAYQAARGLADIQAKAGRRTGERMWRQEAERILARDASRPSA